MKKSSPAVVFKSKFIINTSKQFQSYIDYIDREEAKRNEAYERYSLYNDYMGNPNKTTGIFTKDKNRLSETDKILLKENFATAQKNESIMWQEVYSFDNKWLKEQGLYDPKTQSLDEEKIKNAIRRSIEYSLEKTNIKESAIWSGAIHYNTDNIHIHVAICEPIPTTSRGKRTQKTMDMMKSKFINYLLDFDKEYKEINKILRNDLVKSAKEFDISKDIEMKRLVKEVINNLPKDSRQWHYNYNTMKNANEYLDKLTKYYIKNYKHEEYKEFINRLDEHEKELKRIYGIGERKMYRNYKVNKINEMYTRMGNTFLKEIKEILKEEKENIKDKKVSKEMEQPVKTSNNKEQNINAYTKKISKKIISKRDINKIGKALGDEFDNIKNQQKYLELERKIEYNLE